MNPDRADPEPFRRFRALYPEGENWVVCPWVEDPRTRTIGPLKVRVLSAPHMLSAGGLAAPEE